MNKNQEAPWRIIFALVCAVFALMLFAKSTEKELVAVKQKTWLNNEEVIVSGTQDCPKPALVIIMAAPVMKTCLEFNENEPVSLIVEKQKGSGSSGIQTWTAKSWNPDTNQVLLTGPDGSSVQIAAVPRQELYEKINQAKL